MYIFIIKCTACKGVHGNFDLPNVITIEFKHNTVFNLFFNCF